MNKLLGGLGKVQVGLLIGASFLALALNRVSMARVVLTRRPESPGARAHLLR
jgi:hypothetical protein